ncbi:MAG: carbohydrate-binding family 9-like protein, partial [Armatimonadetes bacterium]|nr:carbohydrate-binding family 9-like protein [Armatimonadota bacterium]
MTVRTCLKSLVMVCLLTLVASSCFSAPTAGAVSASGAIRLDGVLDEPSWNAPPWQSSFLSASVASENAGQPKPVAVQTRFKVLYDASALYIGVECDEPNIDKLRADVTEHDGMVFTDDCVEIFFDPAGEGRYYHHFVVNTRGAWYDDYGVDYGLVHNKLWACPLEVGTKVDVAAKVWRVEVKIPFAALQLKADVGPNWLWNVARERYATGAMELSTWSPLKGNFHS